MTIAPHGGTLVNRVVDGEERRSVFERARALPSLALHPRSVADLELIASGGYSPLTGFMGQADYQRVLHEMRLADGQPWPLPITLRAGDATLPRGSAALAGPDGTILGLLEVREVYTASQREEAQLVYGRPMPSTPAWPSSTRRVSSSSAATSACWLGPVPPSPSWRWTRPTPGACSPSEVGARWSASRLAIPSIARTSTSRRRPWRSWTASCCTRSSERRRMTTSRRSSACGATPVCSSGTTRATAYSLRRSRRPCATPAPGRPYFTRWYGRTTVAPTSSSAAITRA